MKKKQLTQKELTQQVIKSMNTLSVDVLNPKKVSVPVRTYNIGTSMHAILKVCKNEFKLKTKNTWTKTINKKIIL
jgi:hypothetical protein